MRIFKLTLISVLITCSSLFFTACSGSDAPQHPGLKPTNFNVDYVEIYLGRSSISSADFEQYKLSGKNLFQECGIVRSGKFTPKYQKIHALTDNAYTSIMDAVWDLLNLSQQGSAYDKPGTAEQFYDPGKLLVTIKGNRNTLKIETSVDSVSNPKSLPEKALNSLVKLTRGSGQADACGNGGFYGIGATAFE